MGRQRKKRPIPPHLERLGPVPAKDAVGLEERLKAMFERHNKLHRKKTLWVEVFKSDYEATGNPLAVWDAYLTIRELKTPIPEWILSYFDAAARGLLDAKNKTGDVALHLGFELKDGGAGPFKTYRQHHARRYAVAHMLNDLDQHPAMAIDEAAGAAYHATVDRFGPGAFRKRHTTDDAGKIEAAGVETVKGWYRKRSIGG